MYEADHLGAGPRGNAHLQRYQSDPQTGPALVPHRRPIAVRSTDVLHNGS